MQEATKPRAALAVDEQISYTTPDGRISITLLHVRPDAYVVTTRQGTLRIEDNCGSYTTEAEARMVARGYAEMYRAEHPGEQAANVCWACVAGHHNRCTGCACCPAMAGVA